MLSSGIRLKKVSAIIVLYHSNADSVLRLIKRLNDCDSIYLIDNTPGIEKLDERFHYQPKVNYIPLGENKGIAFAQNVGFVKSIADGNNVFFTFDQDSSVDDNYIANMLVELDKITSEEERVAAVGPLIINSRNNESYNREVNSGQESLQGLYSVESIISSGAVYTIEALTYVGLNKSEWFIDLIDIEWCYRARHLGWKIFTSTNVRLEHNLGQSDIKLPGKTLSLASPIRLYYVYRNWLLAMREPSFPLRYKLKKLVFMPCRIIIYSMANSRRERIKYIFKGIKDGLLGRVGEYK
ncbi:glycosyltransferase family 2 protein [Erwinia sp. S43]|uniref:glycosyltransferase family 2 protein n=1 Tax=unclassified Erwinia TaxID=2622719 RepID=UPI00190C2CCB|nr:MULTISPECIES: glycosyltransferase family 2 protein [unclassified Erwinia]MBK0033533.1 glycosyltransferase family 2 protein [Erwinia sp. S43]MCW1874153.1 glycosyltransferase family 2 protein [Erwinia sp. INIA01]